MKGLRVISVVTEGVSAKMLAAALASVVAGLLTRFALDFPVEVDVLLDAVIVGAAAFLVGEKEAV